MQIISKGSTGHEVEKWQTFLRGTLSNSVVLITGVFDDKTDKETKSFQNKKGLVPDGIVGSKTLTIALQSGYPLMEDPTCDQNGPNWPPRPIVGPLSYVDREKLFGKFSYISSPTYGNPEGITITDSWLSNIIQVSIPQLSGISGINKSAMVPFHTLLAPQLIKLFQAWHDAGLMYLIITWGGSWNPRFIRGSRTILSNHALGTAFDINVQWNRLGTQPALNGATGSVRELVDIAYEHGFYWGGWFGYSLNGNPGGRTDGMHFEAYQIC